MNTNLFVVSALVSALAACGKSSSSSHGAAAATTSITSLAIDLNMDDVVAIGTAESGGLRLDDSRGPSTVGITVDSKIVSNMLSVDDEHFTLHKIIPVGDTLVVYATMPTLWTPSSDGTSSTTVTYDTKLPNGSLLMGDCQGWIRIKNETAACLVRDSSFGLNDLSLDAAKKDQSGDIFLSLTKIDVDGNIKILADLSANMDVELIDTTTDGSLVAMLYSMEGNNSTSTLIRVFTQQGTAKTISSQNYAKVVGNFIHTLDGVFTSQGVKVDITGLAQNMFTNVGTSGSKIFGLEGTKLITIDTDAKTAITTQLATNSQTIYSSAFLGTSFYYATLAGLTKVDLSSGSLRLAAPTETKVTGLDGVSLFEMKAVGDRILYSGQSDDTLSYVLGSVTDTTATQNAAEVKVTGIQALQ